MWYSSRTCDSWDADRGSGERDGFGMMGLLVEDDVGGFDDITAAMTSQW